MQNDDFAFSEEANAMQNETNEADEGHQERWIMFAGGLSLLFAVVAGVLFLRARRRPTRLQRAEQAARSVRKQGPPLLRQGVQRTGKAVERARTASQEIANQAGRAVEYTRAAGSSVAEGTQDLLERAQKRVGR